MFKKVAPSPHKKQQKKRKLPPHYAVIAAETVLANKKIQLLIERMKTLAHIEADYWSMLYAPAISAYIEFVQGLPAIKYTAFNKHNGYLELGIRRTIESLVAYRKNHSVQNINPEDVPPTEARWTYAVFTSALFYSLGQIVATYWVSLCDNKGHHSKRWNPFAGNMKSFNTHYRYSFEAVNRDALANYSAALIAQSLLPPEGFAWLAEDRELLEAWLAFLQNDIERGGLIARIILPIEHELLQLPLLESTIIPMPTEEEQPAVTEDSDVDLKIEEMIDQFIEWLRNEIDGHDVRAGRSNDPYKPNLLTHFTQNGIVLLYPQLFQEFFQNYPEFGIDSMNTLVHAMMERGWAERHIAKFTETTSQSAKMNLAGMNKVQHQGQALRLTDPTLLGTKMSAPNANIQTTPSGDSYPAKQQMQSTLTDTFKGG